MWGLVTAALAAVQPDSYIVPFLAAHPALTSVRILGDGTVLYSDGNGVYRKRWSATETLLTNQIDGGYCLSTGLGIVYCIPPVYHLKPMAADSRGNIYIADPDQHLIERYDEQSKSFTPVLAAAGSPTAILAAEDGSVYFNDPAGCRVLRLFNGAATLVAGTGACGYSNDGGPATTAQILSISAITMDAAGQLYIADNVAGVVRRVDSAGVIMTIAGTGIPGNGPDGAPANETQLNAPSGLVFDERGDLYIAEAGGNRVRMAGPDGVMHVIAGTGSAGHDGDYGIANRALLTAPGCLGITQSGTLAICDTDRIRKLVASVPGRWDIPVLTPFVPRPYAAGSWVMLLGDFPGLRTMDWSSSVGPDGTLPTSLGGATVLVNGERAVISYVSPDRIDLLLPSDMPGMTLVTVTVTIPDGPVSGFQIYARPFFPDFLTYLQNGRPYPAALSSAGRLISPAEPATRGDTVRLYLTGLNLAGPIAPPYDTSQTNAMQVILGGIGLPVIAARPYSPGVYEVSFQVPTGAQQGELPVAVFFNGFVSYTPAFLVVQ